MHRIYTETRLHALGDFTFDSGDTIPQAQLAYESYGQLNAKKDNVILLNHALTGSHHAHGWCDSLPQAPALWQPENHEGWWDLMIGSGKALDTDKYFIICCNYLGSCYGSTGPNSVAPDGVKWGARFPKITAKDQVRAQKHLLDSMGIERVHIVAPSVGGFCGLCFTVLYPERVKGLLLIGISYKASMEHQLSIFEQILAIELDPQFKGGHYRDGEEPYKGLALARIICHKLFIDPAQLAKRAGGGLIKQSDMLAWYQVEKNTQSYMLHQGSKFAKRFDANAYLRIIDMWGNFDIVALSGEASLIDSFARIGKAGVPVLLYSISTDNCFTTEEVEEYTQKLLEAGVKARHIQIESIKGHDSFLLEPELYEEGIGEFLG